jgi:hypothetical protein
MGVDGKARRPIFAGVCRADGRTKISLAKYPNTGAGIQVGHAAIFC